MSRKFTRRTFTKAGAAAALTAFGAPYLVRPSVLGANAPNERINVGVIGTGNQSRGDLPGFLRNDDVQVVAVCDVNTGSYGYRDKDHFLGREPARKLVDKYYADKNRAGSYKACDAYVDFRKIIDRPDIDVVAIITPDHWHGVMTLMAAEAGKDIFCQKPLSLTIRQGQEMVKAVRKHKRILQTGSQYRFIPAVRFACELVRNGRIGQLKTINTYIAMNNKKSPGPGWKPMLVPEGFDYDMWLGPAPMAPYHQDRCLYRFRFNLDYSGGQITNFGAHSNDIAQCGNGTSLTGPTEVEGLHAEWPPKGSLFNTALKAKFRARYANGVELICQSGPRGVGVRFEGTEGWVHLDGTRLKTHPESLKDSKIAPDEIHLPKGASPIRNFLDCIKTRQEPIEPVEIGHRTASLCHLGNIAIQLMRKLQWDPEKEQFVGDDEANAMLSRPMRALWQL